MGLPSLFSFGDSLLFHVTRLPFRSAPDKMAKAEMP